MNFWNRLFRREVRSEVVSSDNPLSSLLKSVEISPETAMEIPAVSSCIDFISDCIAGLPIRLYRENRQTNSTEEIKDDDRLRLLNDETGDLLDPFQMKKAVVMDFFLYGSGYIYPEMDGNRVLSLRYIPHGAIASLYRGTDPVFLDRGLLLPSERDRTYYAFDTSELLKGDILKRYQAYKTGLECNVLQIDEARYKEDLPPLGLTWIKLGLQDVLYDPKTKVIYTPNMNQSMTMSENKVSFGNKPVDKAVDDGIMEKRGWITKDGHHIYIGEDGGTDCSAKGKNIFVRGFKNKQALNNHWQNGRTHQDEYKKDGIVTKTQYEARALELAQSACSDTILGYKNALGEIVRYDTLKNDFVKGNPNRNIKTLFKPEEKMVYFERMRKLEAVEDE